MGHWHSVKYAVYRVHYAVCSVKCAPHNRSKAGACLDLYPLSCYQLWTLDPCWLLLAPYGSGHLDLGSFLFAYCSWLLPPGLRLLAFGSWLLAPGSCFLVLGSLSKLLATITKISALDSWPVVLILFSLLLVCGSWLLDPDSWHLDTCVLACSSCSQSPSLLAYLYVMEKMKVRGKDDIKANPYFKIKLLSYLVLVISEFSVKPCFAYPILIQTYQNATKSSKQIQPQILLSWSFLVALGCSLSFLVILGCSWLFLVVLGPPLSFLVVFFVVVIFGCFW